MEPGGLIGSKDQTFENWEDSLKSLGRAYNNNSFHEHSLGSVMPESKTSIGVVGNV